MSRRRWEARGLVGLWQESGRGAKTKWKTEDIEYIENCLNQEQRTYNSTQLAGKLKQERAVDLSSDRFLKNLQKAVRPTACEASKVLRSRTMARIVPFGVPQGHNIRRKTKA